MCCLGLSDERGFVFICGKPKLKSWSPVGRELGPFVFNSFFAQWVKILVSGPSPKIRNPRNVEGGLRMTSSLT